MHSVVQGAERIQGRHYQAQRDLILRNCVFLLVGAVAENPRFFSRGYRRQMERRWHLGFSAVRRLHQRTDDRLGAAIEFLCRSRGVGNVTELLE